MPDVGFADPVEPEALNPVDDPGQRGPQVQRPRLDLGGDLVVLGTPLVPFPAPNCLGAGRQL